MTDDLLTRLRRWRAANLPDENQPYDATNIQDIIPEVIDRIEELEIALRSAIDKCIEICYNTEDDQVDEHGHITGYLGWKEACLKKFYEGIK